MWGICSHWRKPHKATTYFRKTPSLQPNWLLCSCDYTVDLTVFVFLLKRMSVMSGSRTTAHLLSRLLLALSLAWPPSSAQESLISEWRACRTQPPSSIIMLILGYRPTKTCPVTPMRCVQVSLWRPLMLLPPDISAQMTHLLLPGIMEI